MPFLWLPTGVFGLPVASFQPRLGSLGVPWGDFEICFSPQGVTLGCLGLPLGRLGLSRDSSGNAYIVLNKVSKVILFRHLLRNLKSIIHPGRPCNPRKWCLQLWLGISLLHAAGSRITWALKKLPQNILLGVHGLLPFPFETYLISNVQIYVFINVYTYMYILLELLLYFLRLSTCTW